MTGNLFSNTKNIRSLYYIMADDNSKICKHYILGHCKNGDFCTNNHIDDVCRDYFKGKCERGTTCKFKHLLNNFNTKFQLSKTSNRDLNNYKKKSKSHEIQQHKESFEPWYDPTETFEPWYDPADVRIIFGESVKSAHDNQITPKDIIIVNNLFLDMGNVYNKILEEIECIKDENLWIKWYGSTHLIANDDIEWRKKSPTFNKIVKHTSEYFKMKIKATRLNWYDSSDYKNFHRESAPIEDKDKNTNNFTIAISFGETRSVDFQHIKTKTTINFPLIDGSICAFSKDINVQWKHGIPPLHKEKQKNGGGRISIVIWGSVDQLDV